MAFGHGKVILLGEHSVVHGRPALACAIGRGVRADARLANEDRLEISPWNVSVVPDPDAAEPLSRAFAVALAEYGTSRPPVIVEAEVGIPGGSGLGCSAALGVAVLAALDERFGRNRSPVARGEASLAWERVFHGNPSGVDNTMAAVGGVALYRKGAPLEAVQVARPFTLVIGDSGEPASTKSMVESVARQLRHAPEKVGRIFDAIAALVQNGRLALEAGDLAGFGKLMDLNDALLSSLMLSTERLESMCRAAREAGAHGAKLTGGGGGGCMIALVEPSTADRVLSAVAGEGRDAFVVEAGA